MKGRTPGPGPPRPPGLEAPRALTITYRPSEAAIGHVLAAIDAAGLGIIDLTTEEPDLEDLFLELTGHAAA